jgi:hypothetical protein
MKKTMMKVAAIGTLGVMFQLGSCLETIFSALWQNLPITLLTEWTLDNNSVFDLFPDG